ncbi:MAG: Tab2/Atab2 family RNA-binding protein [Limnothrix sp.]
MTIWELDFYSRPILDDNQKKLWEVLICETPTRIKQSPEEVFRYSEYCNNTEVNSITLKNAIQKAIAESGQSPTKIRFFRRQMNNMILKGCEDAGIPATPSRRAYTLMNWIQQREDEVYPEHPNYDEKTAKSTSVKYPALNAIALPDAVRGDKGDKWAIVALEASAFEDFDEWDIDFGEPFPLNTLSPDTKIPGLLIFSPRSIPLAGWMSGLELGFLHLVEEPRPSLVLETGVSDSWIVADFPDQATKKEATDFEATKQRAQGVHFLAVQGDPNEERFAGFWMMKE